jgi:hypothetical protein
MDDANGAQPELYRYLFAAGRFLNVCLPDPTNLILTAESEPKRGFDSEHDRTTTRVIAY